MNALHARVGFRIILASSAGLFRPELPGPLGGPFLFCGCETNGGW
jgi:hypothetical protein